MSLLELDGVSAGYGQVPVLRDVSMRVEEGEVVALLGSNGAGKTTALRTVSGLLRPMAGHVMFADHRIGGLAPSKIVELGFNVVPEGRHVFPALTVHENLEVAGYVPQRKFGRAAVRERIGRVYDLFPRLGERQRQLARTLSGGEQQMLALGRALVNRPRLLALDEPSLGLAPLLVAQIFQTIADIADEGTSILLVEQNARMALGVADRAYLLDTGRIVREDSADAMAADESVQEVYLGG
jgi:branched-chain amino acid transport system ATP-binding protein